MRQTLTHCMFCDKNEISEEHAFPKWLINRFKDVVERPFRTCCNQ